MRGKRAKQIRRFAAKVCGDLAKKTGKKAIAENLVVFPFMGTCVTFGPRRLARTLRRMHVRHEVTPGGIQRAVARCVGGQR